MKIEDYQYRFSRERIIEIETSLRPGNGLMNILVKEKQRKKDSKSLLGSKN